MNKRQNHYLEIIIENQEQMEDGNVSEITKKYLKLMDKYERQLLTICASKKRRFRW